MRVTLLLSLIAFTLAAQEEAPQPFRATVNVVVAPTVVTDSTGNYINGLQPQDFRLFDNKKLQDIKVDVSYVPISLVLAIQSNADMEAVLPKIQRIGSLIRPLVVGEAGEVAIVAFDHRVQRLTEFTSDPDKIEQALKKLRPGSSTSRMIDGVSEGIHMLRNRPRDRRRIVVLISDTQNKGSEGNVRDALTDAQLHNVIIYPVDIHRIVTTLTKKAPPPRPDPFPSTTRHMPAGGTATPSDIQANSPQGNMIPAFVELFKAVKYIFIPNPAEVFAQYTGGKEYSFGGQRGLEEAFTRLGEDLHSQYLISYNPNNKVEGGFHEIHVEVAGHPDYKIRTRPGYWLSGVPE